MTFSPKSNFQESVEIPHLRHRDKRCGSPGAQQKEARNDRTCTTRRRRNGKQPATVTVRDAVIDLMRRFGMTSVFANPGSTELPMFRDFPGDFRYVLGLQEAAVVGMADGYAQATRNAAFVNLHSAAGVGNAMGNIFTASRTARRWSITAGQQARSILPFDPFLSSAQAPSFPSPM